MSTIVLSTGVQIRMGATFNANVTILNPTNAAGQDAQVEIFDWGVEQGWSNPAPVPLEPSGPTPIGPHSHRNFIALITSR